MGLFDVIDDIAEKQVMKTDTGDNRIFGVVIGQIAKNYDKDMPGRVCVCVPVRDEDANELQWAQSRHAIRRVRLGTLLFAGGRGSGASGV